jgi:hypothetical protein
MVARRVAARRLGFTGARRPSSSGGTREWLTTMVMRRVDVAVDLPSRRVLHRVLRQRWPARVNALHDGER